MGLISRYIFRQTIAAVLLILLSLTGVTWIAVALRQIDLMTSQGQNAVEFLRLTALALPTLMAFIAPLAVLIASLHVLNRLSSDSELIVMTAGGASTWRLLTPLLLLATIASLAVAGINHWLAPMANLKLRERITEVRSELIGQVIQAGRFTQPEANLTIHIRDRAPDGALLGLLIHDGRDPKQVSSYLAERGLIVQQGTSAYLLMQNGRILRQKSVAEPSDVVVFDRYAVDLNRFEQKAEAIVAIKPREMQTAALAALPPLTFAQAGNSRGKFVSELHDRSASALYPFAFVLLALAFAGQAQTTRQNRNGLLVGGFAAAVGARMAGIGAANAAVIKPETVLWVYAVPLLTCLISVLLIAKNLYPRPATRIELAIERGGRAIKGAISRLFGGSDKAKDATRRASAKGAGRGVTRSPGGDERRAVNGLRAGH